MPLAICLRTYMKHASIFCSHITSFINCIAAYLYNNSLLSNMLILAEILAHKRLYEKQLRSNKIIYIS